jgi:hypothetical protein
MAAIAPACRTSQPWVVPVLIIGLVALEAMLRLLT